MKENNGRAARHRLQQRLVMAIAILSTMVLLLVGIRTVQTTTTGRETMEQPNDDHHNNGGHLLPLVRGRFDKNNHHRQGRASKTSWSGIFSSSTTTNGMRTLTAADDDINNDPDWQDILQARVHLMDLQVVPNEVTTAVNKYGGVYAVFCRLNWQAHKQDPSVVPMFRDLIQQSPECSDRKIKVDLALVVDKMREWDQQQTTVNLLKLSGVVFHESRCGSTLVANMLAAMNPEKHRVFSESGPPLMAMGHVCGETYQYCSIQTAATVLQDVIYAMSRSDDANEERVFFKIQSAGTRNLPVFTTAFPQTPWIFVYRDPVEIIMSHLPQELRSIRQSNCVRQQLHSPPAAVKMLLQQHFPGEMVRDVPPIEYCAAHLASITTQALASLEESAPFGMPVNYKQLPAQLWEYVLPKHFQMNHLTALEIRNMQNIAGQYSKGRKGQAKTGAFTNDSQEKQASASPEIRQAAQAIMSESYVALEDMAAEKVSATTTS